MKKLQKELRRWLGWHVVLPSALAIAACGVAVIILFRSYGHRNLFGGDLLSLVLVIIILLSIASVIGLLFSWRRSARYVLSLSKDSSDAGVWIMKTAFGKRSDDDPIFQEFPWVRGAPENDGGRAAQHIREWLAKRRTDVLNQSKQLATDMDRDMLLAREFQQALLDRPHPEVPAVHIEGRLRLEFHHRYNPTHALGGDFFDIIPIGNDCAGIFIGDVMGHGVRSALITAILRALLWEFYPRARNSAHFLKEINAEFTDILSVMPTTIFASGFYLVADTTSRIATYACAGHPPPFQLHRDRGRVTRLPMPQPKGAAMGLLPHETYTGETVRLLDGNTFVFFTDGVYECTNPEGEEYGLDRVEQLLQSNIYKSTSEILDSLTKSIEEFVRGEPLADDICLVAVDITTKPKPI